MTCMKVLVLMYTNILISLGNLSVLKTWHIALKPAEKLAEKIYYFVKFYMIKD